MSRYHIDYSLKNGLGHPSVSLYLLGCDNPVKCEGCHNGELIPESNESINMERLKKLLYSSLKKAQFFNKNIYLSFLGGEPLSEYNRDIVLELSEHFKNTFKNINTVLYSWRTPEIIYDELNGFISYIDYGVLGSFDIDKKQDGYIPSSKNQIIYNFKSDEVLERIKLNNNGRVSNDI